MCLAKVDLPEPLWPRMTVKLPRAMERAHRHRGDHRHGTRLHRSGRIHRHAGSPGPPGGAGYGPEAEPGTLFGRAAML